MPYDFILFYTHTSSSIMDFSAALGRYIDIALNGLSSSDISRNEHIIACSEASTIKL